MDQFKEKHGDLIDVHIEDVRDCPDVARIYQVRYVPTLVFLDEEGKMLEKRVGYMPLNALEKLWGDLGYVLAE